MSNWNDNIDTTLSFRMEVNEEGKAYFERMLKEMKDKENAIRERIEHLFGEYVIIGGGEKKDEAYQDLLRLFAIGYQLGWNDRHSLDALKVETKERIKERDAHQKVDFDDADPNHLVHEHIEPPTFEEAQGEIKKGGLTYEVHGNRQNEG